MCLNYQMILFSKFNHNNNPVISFLAGNIYVYCMGAVLFVNIGIMVLNMYRGAKRRRILKGLKQKAKVKKINDQKMNELLMEKFGVKLKDMLHSSMCGFYCKWTTCSGPTRYWSSTNLMSGRQNQFSISNYPFSEHW